MTYCTGYGHRIGSAHAVIWQAGTNWAGPVRIQIYYGDRVHLNIEMMFTVSLVVKIEMTFTVPLVVKIEMILGEKV